MPGYHPDPPGGGIATAPAALGRIRAALTSVPVVPRACFNVRCFPMLVCSRIVEIETVIVFLSS